MKRRSIRPPALRLPVWKGPRLSRKARILRNLVLSLLAGVVLYVAMGCPPYTVKGMVDRMARQYLLPNLKPVYVVKDSYKYDSDYLWGRHYTYIIARSGEDYLAFQYNTHLWESGLFVARFPVLSQDAFCAARMGVLYAAAPGIRDAAFATATVETTRRTFTYTGERLGDEVFGFSYKEDQGPDLETAVDAEYREDEYSYTGQGGTVSGYTRVDADLPVTVTLYGEQGEVVDTLHLTVSTTDIVSWY